MTFHDLQFPVNISFGSSGGPERRTEIVTLANGFEERNTPWSQSRRRYEAGIGVRSLDDLAEVIGFFEARHGQLYGFRWKDWADFKSCAPRDVTNAQDQDLGSGDGVTDRFQLVKHYRSGAQSYTRTITKPVFGTVIVALDGDQKVEGTDFTIDTDQGHVVFATPPLTGETVTAGFEFDVPVRFDTDRLDANLASFEAGSVPTVPIVEVRV
ncbi:MAG: DUF2460 domain-containing protein [Pseudomonadota bacterium]